MAACESDGERLDAWIAAIVQDFRDGTCPDDLVAHIGKHATADLARYLEDGRPLSRWAAGMRNLIEIFEGLHDCYPGKAEQLGRLKAKYESDPVNCTPPPWMKEVRR
jgi:hypothetical protein